MDLAKRQKWEQHVADYRSSGKSAKAWCEANQVKIHTLQYWIKKFHSENKVKSSTQWVQIEECKPENKSTESALVLTIGQVSIKITPDFDPEFLKQVVRTLSQC